MERLRSELGLMAYLAVCFVSLASPTWAAAETSKVRVVGTYTNLRYSTGSGDLGGVEIKIVPARGRGFQGALQIAEGAASELMVVDVIVEKNKISFRIPNSYPIYGGGTFEGAIEPAAIRGHFTFGEAVNEEISLKRGLGYWDR